MKKRKIKLLLFCVGLSSILSVILYATLSTFFVENISHSMPYGFYLKKENINADSNIYVEDVVTFCPEKNSIFIEANTRGYLQEDSKKECWVLPLMKVVKAVEGDLVEITEKEIFVNGEALNVHFFTKDRQGRLLEPARMKRYLIKNELLLLTDAQDGFDSRYFGVVKKENLLLKLVPFLTF
jgi:conjugative transfer signal peptidase TraF